MKYKFDRYKYKELDIRDIEENHRLYEETTPTIWITNHNVEVSLEAVEELEIEYIHIQKSEIDFLRDERLKKLKGISFQYKIKDLTPFYDYNLKQLTHLNLPDGINEFDYKLCPNLISLEGRMPDNYKNFNKLIKLKYLRIFGYRKKNFKEIENLINLRKIEIRLMNCIDLEGLENLTRLEKLTLNKCPRLESLKGINSSNKKLENINLWNCKRLSDISQLSNLEKLKNLRLSQIYKLASLEVLNDIDTLIDIYVNPWNVGVSKGDYDPLFKKFKELNLSSELEIWGESAEYRNKKNNENNLSELRMTLNRSPILNWVRDEEEDFGKIYSQENCYKAQQIIINLVEKLEGNERYLENQKIEFFKECILEINKHNETISGFIETMEREYLCEFFDNLADAAGIDVLDYNDGIADEWRTW